MSRARLSNRCMSDDNIRRTLEPHVFDGTEAVEAIVILVTSASRPPIPRAAIEKIQKRKCAGAVNLDTVVDLLSTTLEAFRATRRPPERHSGHK